MNIDGRGGKFSKNEKCKNDDVLLFIQILCTNHNAKSHKIMKKNNTFINKIIFKKFWPPSGDPWFRQKKM